MKPIKNFAEKLHGLDISVDGSGFMLSATETELWVIPPDWGKNTLCIQFDWEGRKKRYCWVKTGEGRAFYKEQRWESFNPENFKKFDVFMNYWLKKRIQYIWWNEFFN
jgi:hypothetical protein